MSLRRLPVLVVLSLGLLTFSASDLLAQGGEPRKPSVSVLVGGDAIVAGEFNRQEMSGGLSWSTRLEAHSHDEVYRRAFSIGAEIAYPYRPGAELITRATYTAARTRGAVVWIESTSKSPPSSSTLLASVTDYRAWAFEAGHRWIWASSNRVSTYADCAGGIAIVDPIGTDSEYPFAGPGSALYARTVTPTVAVRVGVRLPMSDLWAIALESGVRYQHHLNSDLSDLEVALVREGTFRGRRWSVPFTVVLRF